MGSSSRSEDIENPIEKNGRLRTAHASPRWNFMASNGGNIQKIETQNNYGMAWAAFRPGSAPPLPSLLIGRDDDLKAL